MLEIVQCTMEFDKGIDFIEVHYSTLRNFTAFFALIFPFSLTNENVLSCDNLQIFS
jgi:hypothetical protein